MLGCGEVRSRCRGRFRGCGEVWRQVWKSVLGCKVIGVGKCVEMWRKM